MLGQRGQWRAIAETGSGGKAAGRAMLGGRGEALEGILWLTGRNS